MHGKGRRGGDIAFSLILFIMKYLQPNGIISFVGLDKFASHVIARGLGVYSITALIRGPQAKVFVPSSYGQFSL